MLYFAAWFIVTTLAVLLAFGLCAAAAKPVPPPDGLDANDATNLD